MRTKTFVSERDPSRDPYVTNIDDSDPELSGTCSCPGWIYSKTQPKKDCKHIRDFREEVRSSTAQNDAGATQNASVTEGRSNGEASAQPAFLSKLGDYTPMLASAMPDGLTLDSYIDERWVLEEKYDGHRVVVRVTETPSMKIVRAWSRPRGGKMLDRHLEAHIIRAFQDLPVGVYDGELVLPGGSFADVRRATTLTKLRVVLFDALELLGDSLVSLPYDERREALAVAIAHHTAAIAFEDREQSIFLSSQEPVSKEAVERIWLRGGEGAILKDRKSVYRCGARSKDWIKVKKSGSIEATIVGYIKGKNDPWGSFKLLTDDGTESAAKIATAALKREVKENPDRFLQKRAVIQITCRNADGNLVNPVFDHFANEGD